MEDEKIKYIETDLSIRLIMEDGKVKYVAFGRDVPDGTKVIIGGNETVAFIK